MPTYEYLCKACGRRFDHFQKMTDPPLRRCRCCRRGTVKRQFGTGAGIIFKGSGFYATDHRSENYRKAAKDDSAPAPASATTSPSEPSTTKAAATGGTAPKGKAPC